MAGSWGGCWVHLMFFLSLMDDSRGLPIVQCLERRALYILFLKWEAKSQTKGRKLKFRLHVYIFQFFFVTTSGECTCFQVCSLRAGPPLGKLPSVLAYTL